jgi:HEAT repeat protein
MASLPRSLPGPGELCSASASLRAAAVEALGESPRPEHLGALFTALEDSSGRVRRLAVEALTMLAQAHSHTRNTVRRVLRRRLGEDSEAELRGRIAGALTQLNPTWSSGGPAAASRPRLPQQGIAAPAPRPPADAQGQREKRGGRPAPRPCSITDALYRDEGTYVELGRLGREEEVDYDEHRYYDEGYDEGPKALPASDGLASVGPIEALVQRLTQALHPGGAAPAAHQPTIAHLLTSATYGRLRGLVKPAPVEHRALPAALEAFVRRHGLSLDADAPVCSLPRLALLPLARREGVASLVEPDWPVLKEALLQALLAAPPADDAEAECVALAFHEAIVNGPEGTREALARAPWHEDWAPLAGWLLSATFGDWGERERQGRGSRLTLRNLREAASRYCARGPQLPQGEARHAPQVRTLLAAGGGSLRSLDYPAFRVVGHVALVELTPEQDCELRAVAEAIVRYRQIVHDPRRGAEGLLREIAPGLWSELAAETRAGLVERLRLSTLAYIGLRRLPGLARARLRRSHLVEYWQRPGPRPHESAEAGGVEADEDAGARALEGLVLALLSELHQPHGDDEAKRAPLKELLIEAARAAACCYAWQPLPPVRRDDLASAAGLVDALLRCFDHAPRELAQALGVDPSQGLPRLRGGQPGAVEGRFRRLYRELLRGHKAEGGQRITYLCKPLPKEQALARGELGSDCSSSWVPLRALSPHHVYYGIFDEEGRQLPGYLTVYEAWAAAAEGPARPVLCLETINEPKGLLGGVQQDLLVIFEAVARSRGLHPGLVLITDAGTWNYTNGSQLARCRRARHGEPVWLAPADPVSWRVYQQRCEESRYYSAFAPLYDGTLSLPEAGRTSHRSMPLLAPFDPERDLVQPENLAEARRLAALPVRPVTVTCRDERGEAVGFISS